MTLEELDRYHLLWLELDTRGIYFEPDLFQDVDFKDTYLGRPTLIQEQENIKGRVVWAPALIRFPNGFAAQYTWQKESPYEIKKENDKFYLLKKGELIFEVTLQIKPKFFNKRTSSGIVIGDFIGYNRGKKISTVFSDECSLFEKGEACKFCGFNGAIRHADQEEAGNFIKTAKQIGEAVREGYKEGYNHFVVTGGFIPERRELEYYVDIAEAIREETGIEDFNGTPVVGAPLDLEVIDRYKEAGFRTIATNIEIWNRDMWRAICPGKEKYCGGRQNWENTLKHEVEVFGRGNVRSCIVAGIESKESVLEGVETLADWGIITQVQPWKPHPCSSYAGHQSPVSEWHLDLMKKVYHIYRQYGFTHKQVYDALSHAETIYDHYYDFDGDIIPEEQFHVED